MAVLNGVPGLEVVVCVDGSALIEYDDDEEMQAELGPAAEYQASVTTTKYIEAISEKEFTIKINLNDGFEMDFDSVIVPIKIDGRRMVTPILVKERYMLHFGYKKDAVVIPITREVKGAQVSRPDSRDTEFLKRFMFSKIEASTEDDLLKDVRKDATRMSRIGEIHVAVYRGGQGRGSHAGARSDMELTKVDKVHEKALKGQAKSHNTLLGPATELVKKNYMNVTKLDGEDRPMAIFRFKYRSRDALKSLLIIGRTPSPVPERLSRSASPDSVDLSNLNAEQKKQVAKFLKSLNCGRASTNTPSRLIKRENDDNVVDGGPRKKRKPEKPLMIDLTGDVSDEEGISP